MRYKVIGVFVLVVIVSTAVLFLNKEKIGSKKNFKKFNVVLIVSDALRRDVLGCYGGDAKTPNLDRLAAKGLLFENAYSTAPCTMPSSVSIATGNYSKTYYVMLDKKWKGKNPMFKYAFYVNNNEKLLPKVLREKGYDVKMDVENKTAVRSNNFQGFDEFRKIKQMSKEEITFVENTIGIKDINSNNKPLLSSKYDRLYDFLYYLLTVPDGQRFFLLKWFYDPHAPYNPPDKFRKKIPFEPSKLSKKISFYSTSIIKAFNKAEKRKELSDYDFYYIKELYKAEVESVDERVGYIIKALSLRGLLENTIVVFTSDHGELFGEHYGGGGCFGHWGDYWEQLVHVPLIITGPGIPKRKREKTVLSHLDLMPTLKDYLGVKFKDNAQGKSYSALFSGAFIPDRVLYFDIDSNRLDNIGSNMLNRDALLINNFKLKAYGRRNKGNVFRLFHIANDPGEIINLSVKKRGIVMKLFEEILKFRGKNKMRLYQNLKRINKDIDLESEREKTLKILKSLGYIE